jgi:signal transduction histidine kinase
MAALLATDLQQSRARLVAAREEERRRLRRDLHDGLGPSLAAIVLKLNNAEGQADPDRRVQLLAEARQETRTAIAEVRRLVDGLRPPAIDEVGLIGAIRQAAASLCSPDLSIEVSGPVLLPVLPAAIEVATFRIASEAMTNVQRHAQASRCHVRISTNGAFELSVSDDGRGAPPGTPPGVGWTSMSDRAAELGGTCTITSRAGGGTLVRAVLPLSSSASDREAVSS